MSRRSRRPPPAVRVLTIAGSDSSAGAGIQADLLTFAALGVFGACAVTALTAQDSTGVRRVDAVAARLVAAQLRSALEDGGVTAAKTGMLAREDTVRVVVRLLSGAGVRNLVVDPVVAATNGAKLLDRQGIRCLRDRLVPIARVVTPNRFEASLLSGVEVDDVKSATEAGRRLLRLGARAVLVKGGHLDGAPVDVLVERRGVRRFTGRRVAWGAHGTGCVLSAALTARLALGDDLEGAVTRAKRFVEARLLRAVALGAGRRQLDLRA